MKTATTWTLLAVCNFWATMLFGLPTHPSKNLPSADAWMSSPWTGNDAPFRAIEVKIKERIEKGAKPEELAKEYAAQAAVKPSNPAAQFAWAYMIQKDYKGGSVDAPVLDALSRADPGNVYLYTRLRFLLTREVNLNGDHVYLKSVGYRLLKQNPQDRQVRTALIYALSSAKSGLPQALSQAQDWVRQQPTDAGAHAVLGAIYQTMDGYSRGRKPVYREKAIQQYQAYLRLAPGNDPFRKFAANHITALEEEKPW